MTSSPDDEKFQPLLKRYKVIRDPVHDDIWVTRLECNIIDHPYFQRLRRIKQLATTDLVYPGAIHNRFMHSLGVLFIADSILNACKNNELSKRDSIGTDIHEISNEDIFKTRLVALMHDMAHISWGHTIENEGNLIKKSQWENEPRRKKILNEINPIITLSLKEAGLENRSDILEEIENILIAEENGEDLIHKLKNPYIADIVGDTICADLLDYLKRDFFFSGLHMSYDPRIITYFAVIKYNNQKVKDENPKERLALLIELTEEKVRYDILNSCIQLLRMRYSLAQAVYLHRVKIMFSSMAIKMIQSAKIVNLITDDDLFELGDEVIIYKIGMQKGNDYDSKAAIKLADALHKRKKYKCIHEIKVRGQVNRHPLEMIQEQPEWRYALERFFEEVFELEPGSLIIYPMKENSGKAAKVKILMMDEYGNKITNTFEEMAKTHEKLKDTYEKELDSLRALYQDMWTTCIFVDEKNYEEIMRRLKGRNNLYKNLFKQTLATGRPTKEIISIREIYTSNEGLSPEEESLIYNVIFPSQGGVDVRSEGKKGWNLIHDIDAAIKNIIQHRPSS